MLLSMWSNALLKSTYKIRADVSFICRACSSRCNIIDEGMRGVVVFDATGVRTVFHCSLLLSSFRTYQNTPAPWRAYWGENDAS